MIDRHPRRMRSFRKIYEIRKRFHKALHVFIVIVMTRRLYHIEIDVYEWAYEILGQRLNVQLSTRLQPSNLTQIILIQIALSTAGTTLSRSSSLFAPLPSLMHHMGIVQTFGSETSSSMLSSSSKYEQHLQERCNESVIPQDKQRRDKKEYLCKVKQANPRARAYWRIAYSDTSDL